MANYSLSIIRHGEHKGNLVLPELTATGVVEARQIGQVLLAEGVRDARAFAVDGPRFIGTATLAMMPELAVDDVTSTSAEMVRTGRIIPDDDLDYRPMTDADFKLAMMAAFNSNNAMRFLIEESDAYLTRGDLSTYRSMSRTMAAKLLMAERDTIYCAKELMASTLRARITAARYGQEAVVAYVEWYTQHVEGNPEARTHRITIQTDGQSYLLSDAFGQVDFDRSLLTEIVEVANE